MDDGRWTMDDKGVDTLLAYLAKPLSVFKQEIAQAWPIIYRPSSIVFLNH
jgi:hypothetical protein